MSELEDLLYDLRDKVDDVSRREARLILSTALELCENLEKRHALATEALLGAATQFQTYAEHHEAKGAWAKAETNAVWASRCRSAASGGSRPGVAQPIPSDETIRDHWSRATRLYRRGHSLGQKLALAMADHLESLGVTETDIDRVMGHFA